MELVAEKDGVRFVNDSKATNVESALRSIETSIVISSPSSAAGSKAATSACCGGTARGSAPKRLSPSAKRSRSSGRRSGMSSPVHEAASLEDAVAQAYAIAAPAGVVLLAPACSSFDMFRDYAERGRRFKEEVARLARGQADPL